MRAGTIGTPCNVRIQRLNRHRAVTNLRIICIRTIGKLSWCKMYIISLRSEHHSVQATAASSMKGKTECMIFEQITKSLTFQVVCYVLYLDF